MTIISARTQYKYHYEGSIKQKDRNVKFRNEKSDEFDAECDKLLKERYPRKKREKTNKWIDRTYKHLIEIRGEFLKTSKYIKILEEYEKIEEAIEHHKKMMEKLAPDVVPLPLIDRMNEVEYSFDSRFRSVGRVAEYSREALKPLEKKLLNFGLKAHVARQAANGYHGAGWQLWVNCELWEAKAIDSSTTLLDALKSYELGTNVDVLHPELLMMPFGVREEVLRSAGRCGM